MANKHRSYPLGNEVSELRKHRGEPSAEKELHSYGKMREFSKASGTWGKKNSSPAKSKALEKGKTKWKRSNEVGPAYTKREAKAADKSEEKRINKYFD